MIEALGPVLVSMMTADIRNTRLAVELVSSYDERYLTEVVIPQLGASTAPLTAPPRLSLGGLLTRRRPEVRKPATVVRCRTWIAKPDQWRYEDIDDVGAVVQAHGSDGAKRWTYVNGSVHHWQPEPTKEIRQLTQTAWQQAPNQALREIIEPSLILPALLIKRVDQLDTVFGQAVRLSGSPRSADIVESALVSPWAEECYLDIHSATGIVLAACSLATSGQRLVQHSLVTFETALERGSDIFAVPVEDSFSG